MNFCDKCGTLHTPEECPHNPENQAAAAGGFAAGFSLPPAPPQSAVDVASGMFDVGLNILMSLPKKAVATVENVGATVMETANSAVESAGELLPAAGEAVGSGMTAVLEAGGAVLEGVGSVAGGVAEAAGDILSGL